MTLEPLRVATFGEIMLRLSPPGFQRFIQARTFEVIYGGGEANVAVSLANFGIPVDYITCLPSNDIGEACIQFLRQFGVNTNKILRRGERLGIYFLEKGSSVRGSKVIYDRAHSAIATAKVGMFDWKEMFKDCSWFHFTGITPAISQNLADICLEAVREARKMNLTISCDLNYRAKLWKYGKTAGEIMSELVKYCDIAIGNEEDADKVFGIQAPETNVIKGKVDPEKYQFVCKELIKKFTNLKHVAITLRGSLSASHNTWSAVLHDGNTLFMTRTYDIDYIVDRVGGGDSFCAGLIYGFLTYKDDMQKILDFATAASCLKHTIIGDFNLISVDDVLKLMGGDVSGRVSR
ncbi:MAG: PfkB family carbohydrate kinase [Promethearchaeota archaeon]